MDRAEDFTCVICQRVVDMRWSSFRVHRSTPIAPFCTTCEHTYTEGVGEPKHGSFRDRREVKRGLAIAEALQTAAVHQKWNSHGHA